MCGPAAIMAIASAGVSALGAFGKSQADQQAAEMQAAQYRAQAELQNRQAIMEQTAGQYQQRRAVEKIESLSATQRTLMAGSGFAMTGSPTDVVIDSQREGMLDVAAIKFGTDLKSSNLLYGAAVSGMNAIGAQNAAKTIGQTGLLNALSAGMGAKAPVAAIGDAGITPFINVATDPKKTVKLGLPF